MVGSCDRKEQTWSMWINRFPFSSALLYRESYTLLSLIRRVCCYLFDLERALKLTG